MDVQTVLRGKTAGDRRQMAFAADGNCMTKSYQEMDARAFFSKRGQTAPGNFGGISNRAQTDAVTPAGGRYHGGFHTLSTMDPLSEASPYRRGVLRSRPSSALSRTSYVSRRSHDGLRLYLSIALLFACAKRFPLSSAHALYHEMMQRVISVSNIVAVFFNVLFQGLGVAVAA